MAQAPIDPREWTQVITLLQAYELTGRPDVAALLAVISPERPTPGSLRAWQDLRAFAATVSAYHDEYPLLVAPRGVLDTNDFFLHAHQVADDQAITIPRARLTEHVGIFGRSGIGKTTFAQQLADEAYGQGLNVLTIDAKEDARHLPITYPSTIVITPRTPIPLLEVPKWLSSTDARSLLVRTIKRVWWGGEGLDQVGHEGLRRTHEKYEHPSLMDWHRETIALHEKGETYNRRDRIDGLASRQARTIDVYPGIATTPAGGGITLDDLCTRPVYFGYTVQTPAEELIANWLIELRFAYNRAHAIRTLNTIAHLDEALLFLHEDTITGNASLANTFPLLREFGIGVILTANHYRSLPISVRANIGTHVVMNLSDATDARDMAQTLGLTTAQARINEQLTRGTCAIKLPEGWRRPIQARFAPLTIDKHVTTVDWRAAEERTLRLSRRTISHNIPHQRSASEEVSRQQSALPASSTARSSAKIALNANEEQLLRFIGEHKVVLTTECDLHPQLLTRAKKKLLTLGLINEERIMARAGRGGGANALALSLAGSAWLRITPAGAGGGGLQHQFLVRKLVEAIPGAQREVSLGRKRVDVFFTYSAQHSWLQRIAPTVFNTTDAVAIEVEVSDPTKTVPVNIEKNVAAGVKLTIIATLPKNLARTAEAIVPRWNNDQAILIDVFDLLSTCYA